VPSNTVEFDQVRCGNRGQGSRQNSGETERVDHPLQENDPTEQILSPVLVLFLAGTGTALVTGLGAVPVWLLGTHAAALRPCTLGLGGRRDGGRLDRRPADPRAG
jgi:hypothetical protein